MSQDSKSISGRNLSSGFKKLISPQHRAMLQALNEAATGCEIAVGLDMAANETDWGLCVICFQEGGSEVFPKPKTIPVLLPQPRIKANNSVSPTLLCRPTEVLLREVVSLIANTGCVTSIAVDVPFGWSTHQSEFLQNWSAETGTTSTDELPDSKLFSMRLCDRSLQSSFRAINPLAVGADRIAAAAYRWAKVRRGLADIPTSVDFGLTLPGNGISVFETYPGAYVKLVAPEFSDYKKKPSVRRRLVEYLLDEYQMIQIPPDQTESLEWACEQNGSPDALDAFLCALTAWDHLRYRRSPDTFPLTTPERMLGQVPDAATQQQIRREGWILVRDNASISHQNQ